MHKSRNRKVTIPADLLAEMNALPDTHGYLGKKWTAEMDAVLLKLWGVKQIGDIVALFTKRYGVRAKDTLRKRYNELTA